MRTLLARFFMSIRVCCLQAGKFTRKHRTWLFAQMLAVVAALIIWPDFAHANFELAQQAGLFLVSKFFEVVIIVLGWLVSTFIQLLITFASYNGFSSATPVVQGWIIVRDVINMFFILIVIASAFATVIGHPADLRYDKVLPKLLVMAVLINFSRMIIQLAIDFSQVVMLTFVNGFNQMAAGGFIHALRLNKLLQITEQQVAEGVGVSSLVNQLLAYALATVLLVIAFGTILIMTMYLIFRIVGLWMALILSPIAFFATALPERIQKSISSLTSDYWGRLSALLLGGPIIAFFLWLTMATVQSSIGAGGTSNALGLYDGNLSPEEKGERAGFISKIGNTQDIATFVIAIAMMLMGLEAATSWSGKLGKTAAGLADSIKKRTLASAKTIGKLSAGGGFAAATFGTGPLALAGLSRMEKRFDVRGRMAAGLRRVPGAESTLNQLGQAVTGSKLTLRDIQLQNRKQAKEKAGEDQKFYLQLSADERIAEKKPTVGERLFDNSRLSGITGDKATALKKIEQAKIDGSDDTRKERVASLKDTYASLKDTYGKSASPEEAKKRAEMEVADLQKQALHHGRSVAKQWHEALEDGKLEEMQEKNYLFQDENDRDSFMKKQTDEDLEKMGKDPAARGEVLLSLMKARGVVTMDATGKRIEKFNEGAYHELLSRVEKNKALVAGLSGARNYVRGELSSVGGTVPVADLQQRAFQEIKAGTGRKELQTFARGAAGAPVVMGHSARSAADNTARLGIKTSNFAKSEIVHGVTDIGIPLTSVSDMADEDAKEVQFGTTVGTRLLGEALAAQTNNTRAGVSNEGRLMANSAGFADISGKAKLQSFAIIGASPTSAQTFMQSLYETMPNMNPGQLKFVESFMKSLRTQVKQNQAARAAGNPPPVGGPEEAAEHLFTAAQTAFPKEEIAHMQVIGDPISGIQTQKKVTTRHAAAPGIAAYLY